VKASEIAAKVGVKADDLQGLVKLFADDDKLWEHFSHRVRLTRTLGRHLEDDLKDEDAKRADFDSGKGLTAEMIASKFGLPIEQIKQIMIRA
jgi:hypothetical protein